MGEHVDCLEKRNEYKISVLTPQGKKPFASVILKWELEKTFSVGVN
jgi:hypothetical protein